MPPGGLESTGRIKGRKPTTSQRQPALRDTDAGNRWAWSHVDGSQPPSRPQPAGSGARACSVRAGWEVWCRPHQCLPSSRSACSAGW